MVAPLSHVLDGERISDERLAERVGQGDDDAFEEIYRRWVDALYDFAARTLRDRRQAAQVVYAALTDARGALRRGRRPEDVGAWLFGLARGQAMRRRPTGADAEDPAFAAVAPGRLLHAERGEDRDLAEVAWEAAAALPSQDYSLLDLHLRQDVEASSLAAMLGVRRGEVVAQLSELRSWLDETVTAAVLVRLGECRDLARLDHGVRDHVMACERCQDARRLMTSPLEAFAALAPVALPEETRAEIWKELVSPTPRSAGAARAAGAAEALRTAGARALRDRRRVVGPALPLAVAGVAIGLFVAVVAMGGGDAEAPEPPAGVRGVSHSVGEAEPDRTIRVAWRGERGIQGYSVMFTRDPRAEPPERVNVEADARSTTSRELEPGRWWVAIRAQGEDGEWSTTVRRGPFVIGEPERPKRRRKPKREPVSEEVEQAVPVTPVVPAEEVAPEPAETERPRRRPERRPQQQAQPREQPQRERPAPTPEPEPEPAPTPPPQTPVAPPSTPIAPPPEEPTP
jgi:DNA-directed RNA polymerase specialized sigma24 family protein